MELLNNLTIGIKTFNRPLCLENCLQSIRKLYPKINIIVADDSNDEIKDNNKKITNKYNADLIDLPFDSGLSIGRNSIVNKVKTKYYLTLDDDNFIDENTKIKDILRFMEENPEIDLVGGVCMERKLLYGDDIHVCYSYTFININELDIFCCSNFIKLSDKMKIFKTNLVLNLFIAKTEILKKYPWDPKLKFEEHKPFFVSLYKNNVNCAISYELYFREILDDRRKYIDSVSGYHKINHNKLYNLRVLTLNI